MEHSEETDTLRLSRAVGGSLLTTIGLGIVAAMLIAPGIDINLSADVAATAENMLQAEQRLRAMAYFGVLIFSLDLVFSIGLFLLLRKDGPLIAGWSLAASLVAANMALFGSVFAMNAALIASNPAFGTPIDETQRLVLAGLQATSDYTSFHLSLVVSSLAMAGYFFLFFVSRRIPRLIAGWGLFASLFVAFTIVARDFLPALGHSGLTITFMLSNLIALISLGVFLAFWGVRTRN